MLTKIANDGIESLRNRKLSVLIQASCLSNFVPGLQVVACYNPQSNACLWGPALSSISNKQMDSPIKEFSKQR
jgi:hypothetical protein